MHRANKEKGGEAKDQPDSAVKEEKKEPEEVRTTECQCESTCIYNQVKVNNRSTSFGIFHIPHI